jgi:hypothetical protein
MKLDDVLALVGTPEAREAYEPHWEESVASLPAELPSFLRDDVILASREYANLDPAMEPVLLAAAERVRSTPALVLLAWHCTRLMWEHRDYTSQQMAQWAEFTGDFEGLSGPLWIILALDCVPLTQAKHREMGVPDGVTRTTLSRLWETVNCYQLNHQGRWGYQPHIFYWLRLYVDGTIFGLTRLEFKLGPFNGRVRVFRHRETGEVVALAREWLFFNAKGHLDAGATPESDPDGWQATYEETAEAAEGYFVDPGGHATRLKVRLPFADWELVLQQGDPTYDIHIPAGGGMTPELCRKSMAHAVEFFAEFFPQEPKPKAFACYSWILNPEIAEWYRPDSNMVLWQRELYCFPWPSGGKDGLYFVFAKNENTFDPPNEPRDTSLRRAMLKRLEEGGKLRTGGMFMLTEDLQYYGTEHYRSQERTALQQAAIDGS